MPCYSPLKGFRSQSGSFTMNPRFAVSALTVPCGQCVGCRLERSRQWAVRCCHEASMFERNIFITLTYNKENLPEDNSLHYEDFQKFMKRLRFEYKGHQPLDDGTFPIRFYMCGEYGENFGRPHFHACLFNFDFDDKKLWQKTSSGSLIYRSKKLEALWPFGFSSIGDVNFKSAAYVARYIMKKITGRGSATHYEWVDKETGEIHSRSPEFNKMSLKPGIGARWIQKFMSDVYPHDYVVVNGKPCKPPRFYDKRYFEATKKSIVQFDFLKADDSFPISFKQQFVSLELDELKLRRGEQAEERLDDNTDDRLKVKEQVVLARLDKLKRKLT